MLHAAPCRLPASSRLRDSLPQIDHLDSYMIGAAQPDQSMISLYAAALDHLPHLDFRVSVLREDRSRVVLSTAVRTHSAFGRAYLTTILPFHRYGVAQLPTDAADAGRL